MEAAMRYTKFKGKINTIHGNGKREAFYGQWVVGFPKIRTDRDAPWNVRMEPIGHSSLFAFTVDPETICEYTRVRDRMRTDIYEHDIVSLAGATYEVVAGELGGWELVPYNKDRTSFEIPPNEPRQHIPFDRSVKELAMVVGNKYDDYEPPAYEEGGPSPSLARFAMNDMYKNDDYYSFIHQEETKVDTPIQSEDEEIDR